jgi:hypothetical protein
MYFATFVADVYIVIVAGLTMSHPGGAWVKVREGAAERCLLVEPPNPPVANAMPTTPSRRMATDPTISHTNLADRGRPRCVRRSLGRCSPCDGSSCGNPPGCGSSCSGILAISPHPLPLLDPLDIIEALMTTDAARTCAETARYLVEDTKAAYLLTVKGNRSSLHTTVMAIGREPTTARPII